MIVTWTSPLSQVNSFFDMSARFSNLAEYIDTNPF